MVPSIQDWRDFIAHQKWFFARARARNGTADLLERFDYFAVFWGIFAIGVSADHVVPEVLHALPAGLDHQHRAAWCTSDEALLRAGFIFTFHFFNTHFRIEEIPMIR